MGRHFFALKPAKLNKIMKTLRSHRIALGTICASGLIMAATIFDARSQTAPVLTIAALGTNQFSVTITNGVSAGNYEVWWTPVLADPDYPWTTLAVGTSGQTNFNLNMGVYDTGFFQAVQDTNAIPLWEAANPTNQSLGILTVLIDSPTNGATLTP
jgi:hypothetical protein